MASTPPFDRKDEIVTFKADAELVEALRALPNRSAFIRQALRSALSETCPVCRGSGRLTATQKRHWLDFTRDHAVEECSSCAEPHLVCRAADRDATAGGEEG
jgi:hypothetical protein